MNTRKITLMTAFERPMKAIGALILLMLVTACGGGGGGGGDSGDKSGPVTEPQHQLHLSESPIGAGTSLGEGDYPIGKTVTVSTTPTVGYEFLNWTDTDDKVISEAPSFDITMDQSHSLRANFRLIPTITPVPMPTSGTLTGFEVGDASTGILFATTEEANVDDGFKGVWRSNDGGDNWTQVLTGDVDFVHAASGASDLVIAGISDAYALSTDGGVTWASGVINDTSFGDPMSFSAASITESDVIYLATTDVMDPGLYKSTDQGASWTHILSEAMTSSTRETQVSHVEVSPSSPEVLYAATLYGDNLWKSIDGGSSFYSIKSGLSTDSNAFYEGLTLDRNTADNLLVLNNITVNGGANWSQQANMRPDNTIWLDGDLVRFRVEFSDFKHQGLAEISRDSGATWNRFMPLVLEDGSTLGSIGDVFVSGDSVYIGQSESMIFKVSLQTIRDRIALL